MTTARLRELMDERVADVDGRDLAAPAWARADVVRRRRRYAVVGTAAAAVLVVAGGVAVLDDRSGDQAPPSSRPTSTPTAEPTREPTSVDVPQATLAGDYKDATFWWAPARSERRAPARAPGPRRPRCALHGGRRARHDPTGPR